MTSAAKTALSLRKVAITDHDLCALYWSSLNDFIRELARRYCARLFRATLRQSGPQLWVRLW